MEERNSPYTRGIMGVLFLSLLAIMCSYGSRARELAGTENKFLEIAVNEPTRLDVDAPRAAHTEKTHVHHTNHMDQMDPQLMVFFTMKDLNVGKKMPIYFPKRDPATSPQLWTREQADSVPFSLKELPYLLKYFSFSPNSPQAKAMENTLRECESKPIKGEVKFCATSLGSMLDFIRSIIGLTSDLRVLTTSHETKSTVTFQNYTFLETLMEIPAPKTVACHTMPYPYSVFYCHSQESENKVYMISLAGENGDRVEAIAVCHLDTSQWSPGHPSFQVLKIAPGTSPVCHFFPSDNFVWVPKLQTQDFSSM